MQQPADAQREAHRAPSGSAPTGLGHRRAARLAGRLALASLALALLLALAPVALAKDSVYWANGGTSEGISMANLDGTGGGDLTTAATVDTPRGVAIDAAAGKIYWANFDGDKISVANLDGSGGTELSTGAATVDGPNFPALLKTPLGRAHRRSRTRSASAPP